MKNLFFIFALFIIASCSQTEQLTETPESNKAMINNVTNTVPMLELTPADKIVVDEPNDKPSLPPINDEQVNNNPIKPNVEPEKIWLDPIEKNVIISTYKEYNGSSIFKFNNKRDMFIGNNTYKFTRTYMSSNGLSRYWVYASGQKIRMHIADNGKFIYFSSSDSDKREILLKRQ